VTTLKSAQPLSAQAPGNRIPENVELRRELQQVSRILLIRLRSLGDAILTLPLIEALNQWRPELKQSILIEAPFAPVFLHHPAVAETLILQSRKSTEPGGWTRLRSVIELRKRHYPAVLNLHGGTTSLMLAITSGARLRIGQVNYRSAWLYNRRIPTSADIWQRKSLHTVENQLGPVRWLGIPIPTKPPTLYLEEHARTRIHGRLAEAGIPEFLLIQPTATLPTKQWPAGNFAQLADRLSGKYGLPVIFTSGPHETAVLDEIRKTASGRHTYWSDLPLMDLFALIERCRLFIGCDSGPTHAAAALKKPVAVVWGSSNFQAWHPWRTDFEAVRSELPCIPCPGYRCEQFGEPRCILEIPVSRFVDACSRILERIPR
jgi:heptosyltransferase III